MDKWLNNPTALKIISLLLAVLLWAVVHTDADPAPPTTASNMSTQVIEAVKVVPIGLDTDRYKVTAMEPTVVRLVVEGRITHLRAAALEDYFVQVNLTNVKPGVHDLPLTAKLPKGLQKVEISPQYVTVRVEEIVTKSFDVQVLTEGKPAEGFVAGQPAIISESGSKVQITLPQDDMSRIGTVAVVMDIEGADKNVVNKKARIFVYDSQGNELTNASVAPETLHVEVPVTLPNKQVPLQIRYSGNLPDGVSIVSVKPELEQVYVYAEQSELDGLSVFDGFVLDLSKIKQSGEYKIKASPVEGVRGVSPQELTIQVEIENSSTRLMTAIPISIQGKPQSMKVRMINPENSRMNITVSGSEQALAKLNASSIRIVANIDGLSPGRHTVPLEIELPAYISPVLENNEPLKVELQIEEEVPPEPGGTEQPENTETGTRPEETDDNEQPKESEAPSSSKEPDTQPGNGNNNNATRI